MPKCESYSDNYENKSTQGTSKQNEVCLIFSASPVTGHLTYLFTCSNIVKTIISLKKKLPTHTGKGFFYTNLEVYRINYSSKFHGSKEKKICLHCS